MSQMNIYTVIVYSIAASQNQVICVRDEGLKLTHSIHPKSSPFGPLHWKFKTVYISIF